MNCQADYFVKRQNIMSKFKNLWREVEILERQAIELLGDNDPISESLGLACVYMMNVYFDIEKNQYNSNCNKLEPETLKQIIDLLIRIKWTGPESRRELIEAYQFNVISVGNQSKIHRNTVADACTRRLQLDRDGFLDLVERWLKGDSSGLIKLLKMHTCESLHQSIDDLFDSQSKFQ